MVLWSKNLSADWVADAADSIWSRPRRTDLSQHLVRALAIKFREGIIPAREL